MIEEAAARRADAAMREIMPDAGASCLRQRTACPERSPGFTGRPTIPGISLMITTAGYGGEIRLLCGIDPDGRIIKTAVLAETETKGIATAVFDRENEYMGKDKTLEGIDAVSGATITSNAYKNGILDAFEAFELVKGA